MSSCGQLHVGIYEPVGCKRQHRLSVSDLLTPFMQR